MDKTAVCPSRKKIGQNIKLLGGELDQEQSPYQKVASYFWSKSF